MKHPAETDSGVVMIHNDWFRHSKVEGGTHRSHKPALGKWAKNEAAPLIN
jgi:hypothetical protein